MKIAFIVHDYHRHGGHARYVAELASRFKKEHEVHVYSNTWEEPNPDGIIFHSVPALTWRDICKVLSFILPSTLLAPNGFDVIHAQGLCGLRHDVTTTHFITAAWYHELRKRKKNLPLISFCWEKVVTVLEKYALGPRCSKKVICISYLVATALEREYKIKGNIDIIYHGVDLAKFNPLNKLKYRDQIRLKFGIGSDIFVGLFVGNLQKGADVAIRAVSLVKDSHLILVSNSNNSSEIKLVNDLGIASRVHWASVSKEIEVFFAAADCFIYPSFFDTFGMVISEAMASGLTVITTRKAGASELIKQGVSGILVNDNDDHFEIAKNIQALIENPDLNQKIGVQARKAIEPYTWDRCAEETMAVYQKIVDRKNKVSK